MVELLKTVEQRVTGVHLAGFGAEYEKKYRSAKVVTVMALHEFLEQLVLEIHEHTGKERYFAL